MRRRPCAARLVALALCCAACRAFELTMNVAGTERALRWADGDDVAAVARAFIVEHTLSGGEGCDTVDCVVFLVTTAMRQQVGDCVGAISSKGGSCANRVSVSGERYRAQGRVEVEKQLLVFNSSEAETPAAVLARRGGHVTRFVRAPCPCAVPYCDVECATRDAAAETAAAADFIADDPELSVLLSSWPPSRLCGRRSLHPIFIGIPFSEFISCLPRKRVAAQGGIRDMGTEYTFGASDEAEYKRAYRGAYFGLTKKKSGWDCLRHYEIVASGSVPLFYEQDLDECPSGTLAFWPKKLLARLAVSSGVGRKGDVSEVDPSSLDTSSYASAAAGLLYYARKRLSTAALADYVLERSGHAAAKSVLLLSAHPDPDYVRDMLIHGLRGKLGVGAIDFVRPAHLYADAGDDAQLYGNGFSYAHRLADDSGVDRSNVEARIRDKAFDVIIYASVQRGMPFWTLVLENYDASDIAFIDGEDEHGFSVFSSVLPDLGHYFMRELPDGCPPDLAGENPPLDVDPKSPDFKRLYT
ncbi:hypothetical protein M885DRAFT_521666 [Pelagophyceae sp. CCMP2097]|nr:hypothetical protein M885DRAFT_521666 [Pelagophyceae sp. CCMP2097]|mmetsp:Transcript_9690/g.34090  ORF Transcript_9690/g.34090 Transcript_9690/m.34090 type:complete len:527 (+) Transcript_9690:42-1622(+)